MMELYNSDGVELLYPSSLARCWRRRSTVLCSGSSRESRTYLRVSTVGCIEGLGHLPLTGITVNHE